MGKTRKLEYRRYDGSIDNGSKWFNISKTKKIDERNEKEHKQRQRNKRRVKREIIKRVKE